MSFGRGHPAGGRRISDGRSRCTRTANSAAMAEMVVRSIDNRRNTYRAHRRVVEPTAPPVFRVLIEHCVTTVDGGTAVAGYGHAQHQRVAGNQQEWGEWPGDGVAVTTVATAVRAARITRNWSAEDRCLVLVDGGICDHHAQLNGAHDRVGNNRRRASSSLRHGSPRWCGGRVWNPNRHPPRPTSAQRHEPTTGISRVRCTLDYEEPSKFTVTYACRYVTKRLGCLSSSVAAQELRCIMHSDWPNAPQHVVTIVTTFHIFVMKAGEIITLS